MVFESLIDFDEILTDLEAKYSHSFWILFWNSGDSEEAW